MNSHSICQVINNGRNTYSNSKKKNTKIQKTKETRKEKTSEDCAICLENLTFHNRKKHTTECGHTFHTMCFNKISQNKNDCSSDNYMRIACPYCRTQVNLEPKNKLATLRKEYKDVKYLILCEEMKIYQMYGYNEVLIEIHEMRTEMNKLLIIASKNMPQIIRLKYNMNCRKSEIKYIREVARNHTFTLGIKLRKIQDIIDTFLLDMKSNKK